MLILKCCNVSTPRSPPPLPHPLISRTSWRERDGRWGSFTIFLILQVLSCHWCLFLSLTTSSLTSTALPLLRRLRLGSGYPLAALSPLYVAPAHWKVGGGPVSVVVCCMLALSSSSPLCWQPGVGVGGVTPPRLQPFCSVNPHCLVVLSQLT